jgi:hypothetical protein
MTLVHPRRVWSPKHVFAAPLHAIGSPSLFLLLTHQPVLSQLQQELDELWRQVMFGVEVADYGSTYRKLHREHVWPSQFQLLQAVADKLPLLPCMLAQLLAAL